MHQLIFLRAFCMFKAADGTLLPSHNHRFPSLPHSVRTRPASPAQVPKPGGLLWCPGLGLWASPIAPEPGDLTAHSGLGNVLRAIIITVGAPQVWISPCSWGRWASSCGRKEQGGKRGRETGQRRSLVHGASQWVRIYNCIKWHDSQPW